jgi:hypothetical protein
MRQDMLQERRVLRFAQSPAVLQEGRQRLSGARGGAGDVLRAGQAVLLQPARSRVLRFRSDVQGREVRLQGRADLRRALLQERGDLLERQVLPQGQGQLRRRRVLQEQRVVLWRGLLHGAGNVRRRREGEAVLQPVADLPGRRDSDLLPERHGRDGERVLPADQPQLLCLL